MRDRSAIPAMMAIRARSENNCANILIDICPIQPWTGSALVVELLPLARADIKLPEIIGELAIRGSPKHVQHVIIGQTHSLK